MEKLEDIFQIYYNKAVIYLDEKWISTVEDWHNFDFTMLMKIGLILLFGFFLAKLMSKHIPKAIKFLGKKINISIDDEFTSALRSFIFKLIFFLFVLLAINTLNLPEAILFIASSIVKSILILSFVGFTLTISKLLLYKMANSSKNDKESIQVVQESTLPLFENTILILFSVIAIFQVFAVWNVDMTALLAGAGIGAMAVGMAAKDTLSDIIAGILILTDAPYRVGDVVYVQTNLKGRVSAIGLRNTRIVTKNNVEVIVPNTIMGTSQIVNESSSKKEGIRINIDVSISNGEDIYIVKSLLIQAANSCKKIAQDKEIKSLMTGFQMDMLQFRVQCWINNPEDKGSAKGELMENIYLKFKGENIDVTMTRYQHVKLSYEEAQELYIKQFPNIEQKVFIKEFPDTKQEQFVKEFPDTKQEQFVKEFPDTQQDLSIKEMPNIFGSGTPREMGQAVQTTSIDKDILSNLKKATSKKVTSKKVNNEK